MSRTICIKQHDITDCGAAYAAHFGTVVHFFFCTVGLIGLMLQHQAMAQQSNHANTLVRESTGKPTCLLVLLPGFGSAPESVFDDTELETVAARHSVVTIVPAIESNIYLDDAAYKKIDSTIKIALERYSIDRRKIVIGGFSSGGSMALLFTERAYKNKAAIQPRAVFAIDPPVDLAHLWKTYRKAIQQNLQSPLTQEALILTKYLEDLMGGRPAEKPKQYAQYSAFASQQPDGGNLQFLRNVPVRIYCEPDTAWYKANRGGDYQDLNACCSITAIWQ
jgi:hypothetical protein